MEASSRSVDADAIVIPHGKQLRFRCKFEGCLENRSFSMISIMDHVAAHFARQEGSNRVFNYYCRKCRAWFFLKGMCLNCKCNARGGGEQFIPLKNGITSEDMKLEASFFTFVHKWIVPVFDNIPNAPPANVVRSQTSTGTHEVGDVKQHGPVRIPQEQIPSPKRGRPPTPCPRSSSSKSPDPTALLPKNASSSLSRMPTAFAQEGDSNVMTSEDKSRGCLFPMGHSAVPATTTTPLPCSQGTQFRDDEEGLQLPAYCSPSLLSSQSDTPAVGFLKNGDSATRMNADGENQALKMGSSAQLQRLLQETDVKEEKPPILAPNITTISSVSSTPPTIHPSSSSSSAQLERLLQETDVKEEKPPILAPDITTTLSAALAANVQVSSSPPSPAHASPSSLVFHGDNTSDHAPVQLPPPPPPPPLDAKDSASHSAERSQPNLCDKNAGKCPATTVRVLSKKSRQDGLLEQNPPPPRLSRQMSRSSGIQGSKTHKQSGPKTQDYDPHISSANCLGRVKEETMDQAPTLEIPLPASRTLGGGPSTSVDTREDVHSGTQIRETIGTLSGFSEEGEPRFSGDERSNYQPSALPPPFPPPFFPPPFPPPPYPYMMPGQVPMPSLAFPMYNQFGPPLQSGMPYAGLLAPGTSPSLVPQPRPTLAPTLSMPTVDYCHPYQPNYYPPQH